jgi:hypothetical protein
MTWHSGHSLSQTLYTCLYLDHLDKLTLNAFSPSDKKGDSIPAELLAVVLKAYILGTMKCCQLVWLEMFKGHVYEVRREECDVYPDILIASFYYVILTHTHNSKGGRLYNK